MLKWIASLFKKKLFILYKPITNRCWVCGELSKINCPGFHTKLQKKRMIKHYKTLGYTHGFPSINDTNY